MTGNEALQQLSEREFYQASAGLERMEFLLEQLNHPEKDLKFVHIGGINGKGSVSAMLYAIFNRCEYRAGLCTSPHLFSVKERIQVDNECISEEKLGELAKPVFEVAEMMVEQGMEHPTLSELSLAISLLYFKEQKVDVAMIEVGHGGANDPTNALGVPVVTVLTNMDFQHQEDPLLPLEEFIHEHAGILKEGTNLVLYQQDTKIMEIVTEYCRKLQIPVKISSCRNIKLVNQTPKQQKLMIDGKMTQLSLVGAHQRCNVALTLDAISFLKEHGFGFAQDGIMAGFSRTVWPGRFERVHISPDFILDGSNNVQSTAAVVGTLKEIYPEKPVVFLVGMIEGRDIQGIIGEMLPMAKKFVTVAPHNPRAMAADLLAEEIQKMTSLPVVAAANLSSGVQMSLELAEKEDVVCALGSLHIVGDIRQMLGLC